MDPNTLSGDRPGRRSKKIRLDGYTVHLLSRDGTIATVRRRRADGTYQLIVEVGDYRAARRIPEDVAADPGSAEFTRVVDEMKSELSAHGRRPH